MFDKDKEALDKWFKYEGRFYGTGHAGDEYTVVQNEIVDFIDFLDVLNPDLIGFPCFINKDGIFFTAEDLDKSRYL